MAKVLEVCLGISINFLLVSQVMSYCSYYGSMTLYASTTRNYVSKWSYYNNEDCTFDISPRSLYDDDDYFLELIWIYFDVKVKMPDCKEDYAEVFLTR